MARATELQCHHEKSASKKRVDGKLEDKGKLAGF